MVCFGFAESGVSSRLSLITFLHLYRVTVITAFLLIFLHSHLLPFGPHGRLVFDMLDPYSWFPTFAVQSRKLLSTSFNLHRF